jgi:RNA polymerase sigma factor (sigma-70 family)
MSQAVDVGESLNFGKAPQTAAEFLNNAAALGGRGPQRCPVRALRYRARTHLAAAHMTESPVQDDDATLVARCRDGDAAAWELLVRRYQRLVYTVARRAGLDEHGAADVFQAVFARLFEQLGALRQPDKLRAWIVTSAKREALAQRRLQSRTESLDDGDESTEPADTDPLPEALLGELQLLNQLRGALDRLDTRCRTLLQLLFADDDERLPYEEVSRRLALPVGSIGPTRSRCLAKLRQLFGKT